MRRALLVATAAIVVALATAGCTGTTASAPDSTTATSSPHARAVILAASSDFAIYQVATKVTNLNAGDFYGGHLYALSVSGKTRALTTFEDGPRGLALVRDTVVQEKNHVSKDSSHFTVHYLDLANGREGTLTLTSGDAEMAAAPGGFVRGYRPNITTTYGEVLDLELETYDGALTKLGTPYPDGRQYSVLAGDSGLIAVTVADDDLPDVDATIRSMSWARPGVWTTVFDPHRPEYLSCASPSAMSVACAVSPTGDQSGDRLALIGLESHKVAWLTKSHPGICRDLDLASYGSNLVAMEMSDTAGCTDGRIIRFGADGSFAESTTRYSGLGGIQVGLGSILVSSAQQGELYRLAGASQRPEVIARA